MQAVIMRRLLSVVATAFCLVTALPSNAQQATPEAGPTLRIVVIDLQKVNREGVVFNSIRQQLNGYRESLQALVQTEEDELRKADRELARKRAILAPAAYTDERRKFERRVVNFQRQTEKRKQALNKVRAEALAKANSAVRQVVGKFSTENKITLILRSDMMAFYSTGIDITAPILERLNATVPTVKVNQPEQ
jgi:Skp family chaperone for outer membrane proteins